MNIDPTKLAIEIKQLGKELGFAHVGITDTSLLEDSKHFEEWLTHGFQAGMHYLEKNLDKREHPENLLPGTHRIICCSIAYPASKNPANPIAAFAQRQDYQKFICELLEKYVKKIALKINILQKTRVFAGAGPVLEKALAVKAGIGWRGKNSLLVNTCGSYVFIGEIFTDLPLPIDQPTENRCGTCTRCIDSCPTKALFAPYQVDARKCIAYLTIEHRGEIPDELKPLIGTKIFGCDECQKCCPYNKATNTETPHFKPYSHLANCALDELSSWDEKTFLEKTKDSPLHRLDYLRFRRNLKIAMNNYSNPKLASTNEVK